MDEMNDDLGKGGIDRRRALKIGGIGLAGAWVAPAVLSSSAFAAGVGSNPNNAVCSGQTCDTFSGNCDPNNPGNCFCYDTPTAAGLCETSQSCGDLVGCPDGQSDCPVGTVCITNSCCEAPVCIVLTDQCGNTPAVKGAVKSLAAAGGPTTAHR